jgi:hypothetical protein
MSVRNEYYLNYLQESLLFTGLCPSPTSFFALMQRTKQEKSSLSADKAGQNDRHRALLQRRNFRQSGTSLLAEISYVAALFTLLIIFKGVHELLRKFTATAAPRFGGATARCFEPASPQRVRSKRTIPYSDGFPFKRRRSPLICTLMSAG